MKVNYLGHSTFLLTIDGVKVLIDPFISPNELAKNIDIILADTAGRLPTQNHLMDEIAKVKRVMDKALPGAPHEVLLVLDANTGQNAVNQVKAFDVALKVTGLVLSKLDGTAKGGVVIGISDQFKIPVKYIGVGEKMTDLQLFNRKEFVDSLFKNK